MHGIPSLTVTVIMAYQTTYVVVWMVGACRTIWPGWLDMTFEAINQTAPATIWGQLRWIQPKLQEMFSVQRLIDNDMLRLSQILHEIIGMR